MDEMEKRARTLAREIVHTFVPAGETLERAERICEIAGKLEAFAQSIQAGERQRENELQIALGNTIHAMNDAGARLQWNAKVKATSKSGIKGIHWNTRSKAWQVRIRVNGKRLTVGTFSDKETAASAYRDAALKHRGRVPGERDSYDRQG